MAAFIYLGFVAAGEEIEQPFGTSLPFSPVQESDQLYAHLLGYDDVSSPSAEPSQSFTNSWLQNDLDLDLFCKRIIGSDIEHLKTSPALNVYLGPLQEDPLVAHRRSMTLNEITAAGLGKLEEDGEPHLVGSPVGGGLSRARAAQRVS